MRLLLCFTLVFVFFINQQNPVAEIDLNLDQSDSLVNKLTISYKLERSWIYKFAGTSNEFYPDTISCRSNMLGFYFKYNFANGNNEEDDKYYWDFYNDSMEILTKRKGEIPIYYYKDCSLGIIYKIYNMTKKKGIEFVVRIESDTAYVFSAKEIEHI